MRNANEIAKEIKEMGTWDMELLEELCEGRHARRMERRRRRNI